jgi:hypothetical protein
MRIHRSAAIVLPFVLSVAAFAQSNWEKTYNVSGKAALNVEVDDAGVRVNACGTCRTVRIHVDAKGNDLSKFHLTEMQGGDGIHFSLKHPDARGFLGWHGQSPDVIIDTPVDTQLTVRSGDGGLLVTGIHGGADVHTGDGGIQMSDVSGALHVTTGDGGVQIHQGDGTLFASTGDGSMTLEGRFTQFDVHSGDGSVRLALLQGSKLAASSRISTGNGSIALELPRDLQAEIQAGTGNGNIANSLPLSMTTSGARNNLHGTMNGGGPTVRLQAANGSITLSAR